MVRFVQTTEMRYLLKDNESLYQHAYDIIEPLQRGETKGIITEGVLIECVYVLLKVYEIPRPLIAEKLSTMLAYPDTTPPASTRPRYS